MCIGSDGKVAQTGTYRELAADKEGAFAKLMEWQMSGGNASASAGGGVSPEVSEEERMRLRLEENDEVEGVHVEDVGEIEEARISAAPVKKVGGDGLSGS